MEPATCELQVVGGDDQRAGEDQWHQQRRDDDGAENADDDGAREAGDGERDQHRSAERGAQGAAVQLVERVGADPDGQEERGEREREPRVAEVRREPGPDRDVREVPECVGRMQERDVVAPAAALERVEGRPRDGHARRPQTTMPPPRLRRR